MDYTEKKLIQASVVLVLSIYLTGYLLGISQHKEGFTKVLFVAIALSGIFFEWLAIQALQKRFIGLVGEYKVRSILSTMWSEGIRSLHSVELPDPRGGNIDHIVIAPSGVYAFETKKWEGVFTSPDHLQRKHLLNKDPFKQVKRNAARVSDYLRSKGVNQYVTPVIVIAGEYPKVRFGLEPAKDNVYVISDKGIRTLLFSRQSKARLTKAQVEKIFSMFNGK